MQYWLYAFKWGKGNVLIGKYETYEEANIERDRLDPEEYEYADIVETDWQKEPRIISSYSFEYRKKEKENMKDRYVLTITVLCILLFLSLFFGYLLFEISNDLKATANGYESDRNICRREYEELAENYEKLEAMYNEISQEK